MEHPIPDNTVVDVGHNTIIANSLHDAARLALQGITPNIIHLTTPLKAEGNSDDEKNFSSRDHFNRVFEWLHDTVSSPEYAHFKDTVAQLLEGVSGQHFVIDLEGTLMGLADDLMGTEVEYVNPYMYAVVEQLIQNGNHIGFWTAASREKTTKMQQAMPHSLSQSPVFCQEDWKGILDLASNADSLPTEQIQQTIATKYDGANPPSQNVISSVLSLSTIDRYRTEPNHLIRYNKFPQLLVNPNKGFFIDDNDTFINSATSSGWPTDRAVKVMYNPNEQQVLEAARLIGIAATETPPYV